MAWQALLRGLDGAAPASGPRGEPVRQRLALQGRHRQLWPARLLGDAARVLQAPSGDCEDYAITKYLSLRQLGFAADRLRLVVVQDVVRDLAHAVLAVYLDDEVYILDNLTEAVLPQEQVAQYVPYYSVNELTRWAHVPPADTLVSSAAGRSSPSVGRADPVPSGPAERGRPRHGAGPGGPALRP